MGKGYRKGNVRRREESDKESCLNPSTSTLVCSLTIPLLSSNLGKEGGDDKNKQTLEMIVDSIALGKP